jgi:hypothetical protein
MQDALFDSGCKQAMELEMDALHQKMECGSLFRYCLVNRLFVANGFTLLSLILMAQLNG